MKEHPWCSRTKTVIDCCLALADQPLAEAAHKTDTYFQNNLLRMDYAHFRQQGNLIDSGAVESGCKQISAIRRKRSGARWLEDGDRLVAKARAVWLSDQWQGCCLGMTRYLSPFSQFLLLPPKSISSLATPSTWICPFQCS